MNPKKSSTSPEGTASPTPEQISELAHTLWLEEGKPEGRDLHHWLEAERQLRTGDGARGGNRVPDRDKSAEPNRRDVEADKRVDGLGPINRDPRTPKGERL